MAPVDAQNSAIPGAIPPKGRKPVWDAAKLPCKISRRSVKKSVTVHEKKERNSKRSISPYTTYGGINSLSVRTAHISVHMIVHNCVTQYSTDSSDNLPSYPPDNHHSSDVV